MSKPVERNFATEGLSVCDPVWDRLRTEAEEMAASEPMLASFLFVTILNHRSFESALPIIWRRRSAAQKCAPCNCASCLMKCCARTQNGRGGPRRYRCLF